MKKSSIHIGTSGWKYKHWDGVFYPKELKKVSQLPYYYQIFNTVELNNTFYRQPNALQFENWKNSVPPDFIFAVKANRYFTHLKKLKITAQEINILLDETAHLAEKLGPILFQLPPKWNINLERLEFFLSLLPKTFRYTFEFRNQTWYTEEVYQLLTQHNCAFCGYDLAGHASPLPTTADFIYVRLHGPGEKYQGSYSETELNKWADFALQHCDEGKDVFIYFDNDQAGYAAFNAQLIKKMIDEKTEISAIGSQ